MNNSSDRKPFLTEEEVNLLLHGGSGLDSSLAPLADQIWLNREKDPELVMLARVVKDVMSRARWYGVADFPTELLVAAAVRETLNRTPVEEKLG